MSSEETSAAPSAAEEPSHHQRADDRRDEDKWQNSEYFESYAELDIHEEMLRDQARTETSVGGARTRHVSTS